MKNMITKEQMDYFWKKKNFIYFILSIFVFLIHISSFAQYSANEGIMSFVNEKTSFFFKESITRFAVPMYFILSGMIFFRDYTNEKYISKIKSRFFTLIIPYLIWNTVWLIIDIVSSYTFLSSFFSSRPLSVGSVLKSIFLAKWNLPFWFLLYLIVFVLLSPIFDLLAKNKYAAIVSLGFLSALSIIDFGMIKYDSVVFYLLGAVLGKHYLGFVTKKASKKSGIFSIIFLFIYIVLKNIFPSSEYWGKPFVKIVVFVLASYAFWSVMDLFMDKIPYSPVYSRSFAVFVLHLNFSSLVCKLLYFIFPKNAYFAFPNFVLTLVLTLLAINVFCIVTERCIPRTYALLMGKGIKDK